MHGIRRALALTTAERYFSLLINFATLAFVSRLLTPAEIGISVLGMTVWVLALSIREFATTNFIVQRKELKAEQVRAVFTVLLLLTAAISFVIATFSSVLAAVYEESNLAPYLRIISLCILIEIIGALIAALLRREMFFGKLAAINVAGAASYAVVTITLAVLGFSYMSFAWALLVSQIMVACLSILIWRDISIFKPCLTGWREILTFGGYNGVNLLFFRIFETLPYLVLGRILSVEAVALYNRGITICQLPEKVFLGGVGSVLLSAFSVEARNDRGLRDAYLRSVEMITAFLWPALISLVILADPIVRLLLGDQWLGSVPLVRIMGFAFLLLFSQWLSYPVLVAVGAMRDLMMRSIIAWPISALIITAAAFFGLMAVAFSWLVIVPFQAYVSFYFVRRHLDIRWRDIALALSKAAVLTVSCAIGPLLVVLLAGGFDLSMSAAAFAIVLSAVGWGAGLWLTNHPLLQEFEHAWVGLQGPRFTERALAHGSRLLKKSKFARSGTT